MTAGDEAGGEKDADELVQSASILRPALLGIIITTTAATPGNVIPFSSIALPQMNLPLDDASWYNSLPALAAPFAIVFIALTMDSCGRRIGLLSNLIPNTIGWFLLAEKNISLTRVYIARLLIGFALGACFLPPIVYVAESIAVNNIRVRSAMGAWVIFSQVFGGVIMYLLSLILSYEKVAFIFGSVSAVSLFAVLILIPESPAWLYQKGRTGDADVAQLRLGIKLPLLRTHKLPAPAAVDSRTSASFRRSLVQYLGQIRRRDVYKPLLITTALQFICDFSGIYCVLSHMVEVITVYPLESSPYVLSFICQVIQLIGCVLLNFVLPRWGVRISSIVSFLIASASFLLLALAILFENSSSSNIFNYLHVLSVWTAMLASQLGMLAIPYALLGEVFPIAAKGFATVALFADALFTFVILKIFPYAYAGYKDVVFFAFSVICAGGAAFVVACLPETVGKTMEQIQDDFDKESVKNIVDSE